MKKRIITILACILVLSMLLCSCGKADEKDSGEDTEKTNKFDEIVLKTDKYSVDVSQMAYLLDYNVQVFLSNNSAYSSYLDTSASLKSQNLPSSETTWFSYFSDTTVAVAKQYIVLAEAADAAGRSVTDEMKDKIADYKVSLKQAATNSGYNTVQEFLNNQYGNNGVTEAKIMDVLLLNLYAMQYYSDILDGIEVTDAQMEEYAKENYVSARHILVEDEATANKLLAEIRSAKDVEKKFISLVEDNTKDEGSIENGGLYSDFTRGKMITEFNDWCFDSSRQTGDTDIVKTSYGYHIMYFVSKGTVTDDNKDTLESAIISEEYEKLYSEWQEKFKIEEHTDLMENIDL